MQATATAPHRMRRPVLRQHPRSAPRVNVGEKERMLSVLSGGALGLFGLTRGSLGGFALAAIGGSLLYRGMTGHCSLYQALDVSTATPRGPAESREDWLSWDMAREMNAGGMTIGAHTVTHPVLASIALEDQRRIFNDFEQLHPKGALSKGTGLGLLPRRRPFASNGYCVRAAPRRWLTPSPWPAATP